MLILEKKTQFLKMITSKSVAYLKFILSKQNSWINICEGHIHAKLVQWPTVQCCVSCKSHLQCIKFNQIGPPLWRRLSVGFELDITTHLAKPYPVTGFTIILSHPGKCVSIKHERNRKHQWSMFKKSRFLFSFFSVISDWCFEF